jgi:hypothetical protein
VSEKPCECPEVGPGERFVCPRYGITQGPYSRARCAGTNCPADVSEASRRKWRLRKDAREGRPVDPNQGRVRLPLVLRPVCRWQGDEVPGCKTCGGPGSIPYYCDSPDDDADRCVRGRSRDRTVRSCLDCPHYSDGSSKSATTGTPETTR